jgi:hypothetical protein
MIGLGKPRTRWKGQALLFLDRLEELLRCEGFGRVHVVEEMDWREWHRPLFPGYVVAFSVHESALRAPRGTFGFSASISVLSQRQTEVRNALAMWECANLDPVQNRLGDLQRGEDPACVLHASLNWLIGAWEPRLPSFLEAGTRWFQVKHEDAVACAEDVFSFYQRQGREFVSYIDTPLRLARVLQNLDGLPGPRKGSRPGSSEPSQFAAVLMVDCGLADEASQELDLAEKYLVASVARGEREPITLQVLQCEHSRLKLWMAAKAHNVEFATKG